MSTTQPKAEQNGKPQTAGLYPKLAAAFAEVGHVEKDSKNDHFKYAYTSAEEMLRAVRGPLLNRGVILLASVTDLDKQGSLTTVQIRFTFIDSESGEKHELDWKGTGDDKGDKGLYKAYTGAIKTFMREQFLLPMGDDPEADKEADKRAAQRQASGSVPEDEGGSEHLAAIRGFYKTSGWDAERLRTELVAAGATDVSDVRKAMKALDDDQAAQLLDVLSTEVAA